MVSGAIGAAIAFMLTVMPACAFSGPDKQLTGDCRSLTGTRNHDKKNKSPHENLKKWKKLEQLMGEKDAAAICNEKGEIIFSKNATILAAPASTL
ncbi:MAG: hypothetical protein GY699_15145, partial [Desulfobacteraceae bacterium]|nr:hypothetical protein [Desulfobacteraceae bacterium]